MKAGVLFSGGKDSSLAAFMLSRDYEVELNTFVFDKNTQITGVEKASEVLGLPLKKRVFEEGLLSIVMDMMVESGYPNEAINFVHRCAINALCQEYDVIGDGTRLNDRVPMLNYAEVQSLEGKYNCALVRPLLGFGRREVNRLVEKHFIVLYGETGEITNGDYENEIRAAFNAKETDPYKIFPGHHEQSLVIKKACKNQSGDI
ncbi:alpha hydrolase [Methanomicrobium antiquum]|uniref:Alpha hydrolase n=1 Tax=Methanomicrobium antiquum TaxID=487686 RepID=A0AAF0FX34_9EURY|nr:alpha hydrolase [Methanomicrobium antiquum]MDD3976892.1 alpha hydrolase [Methanomicrobium sp.]WFN37565.1 alpha hydrolase [Methanomicrobium antiquum]